MAPNIASEIHPLRKGFFFERLRNVGVKAITGTKVKCIELPKVTVSAGDYVYDLDGFDTAVLAFGRSKVNTLEQEIAASGFTGQVYVIGDANNVSTAFKAILAGAECAAKMP